MTPSLRRFQQTVDGCEARLSKWTLHQLFIGDRWNDASAVYAIVQRMARNGDLGGAGHPCVQLVQRFLVERSDDWLGMWGTLVGAERLLVSICANDDRLLDAKMQATAH